MRRCGCIKQNRVPEAESVVDWIEHRNRGHFSLHPLTTCHNLCPACVCICPPVIHSCLMLISASTLADHAKVESGRREEKENESQELVDYEMRRPKKRL